MLPTSPYLGWAGSGIYHHCNHGKTVNMAWAGRQALGHGRNHWCGGVSPLPHVASWALSHTPACYYHAHASLKASRHVASSMAGIAYPPATILLTIACHYCRRTAACLAVCLPACTLPNCLPLLQLAPTYSLTPACLLPLPQPPPPCTAFPTLPTRFLPYPPSFLLLLEVMILLSFFFFSVPLKAYTQKDRTGQDGQLVSLTARQNGVVSTLWRGQVGHAHTLARVRDGRRTLGCHGSCYTDLYVAFNIFHILCWCGSLIHYMPLYLPHFPGLGIPVHSCSFDFTHFPCLVNPLTLHTSILYMPYAFCHTHVLPV